MHCNFGSLIFCIVIKLCTKLSSSNLYRASDCCVFNARFDGYVSRRIHFILHYLFNIKLYDLSGCWRLGAVLWCYVQMKISELIFYFIQSLHFKTWLPRIFPPLKNFHPERWYGFPHYCSRLPALWAALWECEWRADIVKVNFIICEFMTKSILNRLLIFKLF